MPLALAIQKPHFALKVWHITESVDFFKAQTPLFDTEKKIIAKITRPARQKQWWATRYLQKQMTANAEVVKNEYGKPFLKDKSAFISLSHCAEYAVCIVSAQYNVGVDIEPMRPKVLRLASKFLSEKELDFIEEKNAVKHLITCWAMKEAVYKWYGKKYISFKNNLQIEPFRYNDNLSRIRITVQSPEKQYTLRAFHLNFKEHSLVFCFAQKDLNLVHKEQ